MEGLAPPHKTCLDLRFGIEAGQSVRSTLTELLRSSNCLMKKEIIECFLVFEQGGTFSNATFERKYPHRRALQDLMLAGLRGEPILTTLIELENELSVTANNEIEEHISKLPLVLTIYMLLFQLPGIVLIILWPILIEIVRGIK